MENAYGLTRGEKSAFVGEIAWYVECDFRNKCCGGYGGITVEDSLKRKSEAFFWVNGLIHFVNDCKNIHEQDCCFVTYSMLDGSLISDPRNIGMKVRCLIEAKIDRKGAQLFASRIMRDDAVQWRKHYSQCQRRIHNRFGKIAN